MAAILFHAVQGQHPFDWNEFVRQASALPLSREALRLGQGAWLLTGTDAEGDREKLAQLALRQKIDFRTLLFDHLPQWQRGL